MNKSKKLHILGGGPSGLASAYFAKKNGMTFLLFESNNQVGGNCRTISYKNFKFDLGAHRFHDKDDYVTSIIKNLLGNELQSVTTTSKIFFEGKMISFPIEIKDLFKNLEKFYIRKILLENIINFFKYKKTKNFKEYVIQKYGTTISDLFINNYSEKLWGEDPKLLSPIISGGRLKDLNILSIINTFSKKKHFEGSFYYPKNGFGVIFQKIKDEIGDQNIKLNSNISKIYHENYKIIGIEINNKKRIKVDNLINSLPLSLTAKILEPKPSKKILELINTIKYRNLRIGVIFLKMKNFSNYASIYFPEKEVIFSRIYEPKQRSKFLAPLDKTCIVVEVPCNKSDQIYNLSENEFISCLIKSLTKMNLIDKNKIIESLSFNIPYAYPVLKNDTINNVEQIKKYFNDFTNMKIIGRSSQFKYLHTHNIFKIAKDQINLLIQE